MGITLAFVMIFVLLVFIVSPMNNSERYESFYCLRGQVPSKIGSISSLRFSFLTNYSYGNLPLEITTILIYSQPYLAEANIWAQEG